MVRCSSGGSSFSVSIASMEPFFPFLLFMGVDSVLEFENYQYDIVGKLPLEISSLILRYVWFLVYVNHAM